MASTITAILDRPLGLILGIFDRPMAALQRRFSDIVGPDTRDICYATQNRQSAVRDLCQVADLILVVGAKNSSNSNRLREIGTESGIPSYLIADGSELNPDWVEQLLTLANSPAGLRLVAEPEQEQG